MKHKFLVFAAILFYQNGFSQDLYYPPLIGDEWQTISPKSIGWCDQEIINLYDFLETKDTKAFIVLKDGKIVLEKYFGTFSRDSSWYWASAGKTMISYLVGIGVDKGLIDIEKSSSTYLGRGWTSLSPEQEEKITVKHHLSMTTGLDDGILNDNCELPSCLTYLASPGTRWAYYNAPYRILHDVIAKASGMTLQSFMSREITLKTGIGGLWIDKVLYSKPRSMARFGLLALSNGMWGSQSILKNESYLAEMILPSQSINLAYGYLWWLNGQSTFMLPTVQLKFPGELVPNAPADMYCALGKNDQKIYVVPSQNIVVVRMGKDGGEVTGAVSSFDNQLWEKINQLTCTSAANDIKSSETKLFFENPSNSFPPIAIISANYINPKIQVVGAAGDIIFNGDEAAYQQWQTSNRLDSGFYIVRIRSTGQPRFDDYKMVIR